MTLLHEHERYLDTLDARFYVRDSEICVNFTNPFRIALEECSSLSALIQQARFLTIRLIDEHDVFIQYLVERLVRLAAQFHKMEIDSKDFGRSVGLINIKDVVYKIIDDLLPNHISLHFANGQGEYAGFHFLTLTRNWTNLHTPFFITRNMIGYHGYKQHAIVSELEVVETDTHLIFFLPPKTSWEFEYQFTDIKDSQRDYYQGNHFALSHSFDDTQLASIQTDLRSLMQGLPFKYSRYNK